MQLPQISLVDSRPLRDHLLKANGVTTIRECSLDVSDIRDWLNRGDKLFWIPTIYLLVAPRTKHYPYTPILDDYRIHYRYNFADQYGTLERPAEDIAVPADIDGPWQ
eukprot:15971504-Heterocapsa_arctica.AAC.1